MATFAQCPLFPRKRTSAESIEMSVKSISGLMHCSIVMSIRSPRRHGRSYFGGDGIAEEWWSTISQRSPVLT